MKRIILFLFVTVFLVACKTQKPSVTQSSRTEKSVQTLKVDKAKYAALIKEAWLLYEQKDFVNSGRKYQEGFDVMGGNADADDRYNAACSFSLAGDADEAFYHLFRLVNINRYFDFGHITTDPDLDFLHNDKRWDEIVRTVKWNQKNEEKYFDRPLVARLEKIYTIDQKYRRQLLGIRKKYGYGSKEMQAQWNIIKEKDSLNLIEVEKILDSKGWLGKKNIGNKGSKTLFLVIQHASLDVQLKYLPMMRDAVKKGNAEASQLALLEDRVALGQGKRQIYGSQIYTDSETKEMYVAPLIDPEHVDERRSKVGLGSLAEYVRNWNLVWDVEKHKERIAQIEAKKKAKKEKAHR